MADKVLNSISGVLNVLVSAFNTAKEPVADLPPVLIMTGAKLRTGLSVQAIASRIISRQSEAGLVVGDVFADGPNTTEAMLVIIIEEIVNAILTESRVDIVIPPGINLSAIGIGNMGMPVIVQGATTAMGIGSGIIR